MRPEPPEKCAIARSIEVRAGEDDEQRRRVDAAVIAAERHFAEAGHFTGARLVQDLARLRVLLRAHGIGLGRGEIGEHAAGDIGTDPKGLQSGNNSVAAEGRAEPWDACIRIVAVRRARREHSQVGRRPPHPLIEALARCLHDCVRAGRPVDIRRQFRLRHVVRAQGLRPPLTLAADRHRQRCLGLRRQLVLESRSRVRDFARRIAPFDQRRALFIIESAIGEAQVSIPVNGWQLRAAPIARRPANLEDVGEVRVDVERQRQRDRLVSVVAEANALVPRVGPQKARPKQVHDIAQQDVLAVAHRHVGIGEIGPEQLVIGLDAGAEQQRTPAVQAQAERREISRPLVIQPLLSGTEGADVAAQIEDGEGVIVLQDGSALRRARRGRENVELILNLDQIFHGYASAASAVAPASTRS